MRLHLDGTEVKCDAECASLEDAFVRLEAAAGERHRVIQEFRLDGETVRPEDRATVGNRPAAEYDRVDAKSLPAAKAAENILAGVSSSIADARDALGRTAEKLRSGDLAGGLRLVNSVMEGVNVLLQGTANAAVLTGRPFDTKAVTDPIVSSMHALQDAAGANDAFAALDAVEGELLPAVEAFASAVDAMRQSGA